MHFNIIDFFAFNLNILMASYKYNLTKQKLI